MERLLTRLGAVPTDLGPPHLVSSCGAGGKETFLSRRTVYRFEDSFYRVDELLFREKPFLVMECASREEEVQNNTMEDAAPFPWDLGEEEILAELRELLAGDEEMDQLSGMEPT